MLTSHMHEFFVTLLSEVGSGFKTMRRIQICKIKRIHADPDPQLVNVEYSSCLRTLREKTAANVLDVKSFTPDFNERHQRLRLV
jgi:hypothetical protein